MSKYEDVNAQVGAKENVGTIRLNSPERNAYLVISSFFNADSLTDEKCEEFKLWFMGNNYAASKKK